MAVGGAELPRERQRVSGATAAGRLAREHWLIGAVLLVGALVRALSMAAFTPALFFPDSWGYLFTAYSNGPLVGLPGLRPVGYPVLIRILTAPDRNLDQLVAIQHLTGLAIGLAIYVVLIRLRLPRWAAAAAAALVLLDGYAITLEQYVMSDTFFSALLLATVLLLAWTRLFPTDTSHGPRPASARRAGLAGLLLAVTALDREAAVFLVPVIAVYLLWTRGGWRPLVAFIAAVAIPLGAYATVIDHKYKVFGVTAASGWTFYGRVAGFADCGGVRLQAAARPLCETAAERAGHPDNPTWYIWGPSPARRLFHPDTASIAQSARANSILRTFAQDIALHQPLSLLSATLGDFGRYFIPGATPFENSVSATSLPPRASAEAHDRSVQRRYLPHVRPRVQSPAPLVRAYRSIMHLPRPLLAVLALAALLAVIRRVPGRREIFLIAGSGVILLLGTAATAGLGIRYLIPAVPLFAIGGCLALAQAARTGRRRSA